jgi:RimK family alpha-L-glutamate ligase
MNGLFIVNQEIGHNAHKVARLSEEFKKASVNIDVFVNNGTLALIKDNNVKINLPKADFVIYMDKDIYLARLLEKAGYRLFNKADFIKLCDDKMLTFIACANHDIPMPATISGPLVYYGLKETHLSFLKNVENELGYPMVVKKVYGSLGEGVYLVKNHDELSKLYSEICRNPIVFQKYISSSAGKSIRVLIIDGKVFGAFFRKNAQDFRSNYGDNASGEMITNIKKYADFACKISKLFNIEYAGLDLLDNDGKLMLCEMNSNAFFEEFENITRLNVAKAVVDMIIKKVNSKHE